MKKSVIFCLLMCAACIMMQAQTKKTSTSKPKPPASTPLKTLIDSASYAIGVSVANFYKQQGITNLNAAMVTKACADVFANKKLLLDDMQANNVLMNYMNRLQESKAKPAIQAGEKFLAENKKKQGVMTTPSGLQYEIITQGTGPKPTPADSVTCHYKGSLLNGTEFENSFQSGEPVTFAVAGVIRGWTEALQLMPVGSKYKLYVPHHLAYGAADNGPIPGGSVLIFEVELLKIVGK
jgi:FKBP-type peptidyl-prolyl cis-trans isomerase